MGRQSGVRVSATQAMWLLVIIIGAPLCILTIHDVGTQVGLRFAGYLVIICLLWTVALWRVAAADWPGAESVGHRADAEPPRDGLRAGGVRAGWRARPPGDCRHRRLGAGRLDRNGQRLAGWPARSPRGRDALRQFARHRVRLVADALERGGGHSAGWPTVDCLTATSRALYPSATCPQSRESTRRRWPVVESRDWDDADGDADGRVAPITGAVRDDYLR